MLNFTKFLNLKYYLESKKDDGIFKVLRSRTVNYIDHSREKTIKALKVLAKQVLSSDLNEKSKYQTFHCRSLH